MIRSLMNYEDLTLWFVEGGDVAQSYDLQAYPTTIIYGKDGKEANKHIGFVSEKEFDDEISILLKR